MMKSILAASVLTVGVVSAAFALPAHVTSPNAATSDLLQVKKDWKKGDWKHDNWKKSGNWHKYNKNKYSHRYNYPPHGWRSYNYRPYGWANRGCVIIGPLWYSP
jgi:opacity protein-like surface antigen